MLLFILLLFISSTLTTSIYPTNTNTNDSCDLSCWLFKLKIHIVPEPIIQDSFNMSISIFCQEVILGKISSIPLSNTKLHLEFSDIGTVCSGNWSVRQVDFPSVLHSSGSLSLNISQTLFKTDTSIQFTNHLPTKISVSDCVMSLNIAHIKFSGGIASDILDIFEPLIQPSLERYIGSAACTEIADLATNMTILASDFDSDISPYNGGPVQFPSPTIPPNTLSLTSTPVLRLLDFILDQVVGSHGPLNINKIVDGILSPSGNISLDETNLVFSFNISSLSNNSLGNLGTIDINIGNITLSGLNTWDIFSLFDPIPNHPSDMSSLLQIQNFTSKLRVSLNVTTGSGPMSDVPLDVLFDFSLGLHNLTINTTTTLAISQLFENITFNQLSDPDCVASIIKVLNWTQLYFSADDYNISLVPVSSQPVPLEEDVDKLINNFISLFLVDSSFLQPLINYGLSTSARPYINSLIFNYTSTKSCPPHDDPQINNPLNTKTTPWAFGTAFAIGFIIGALIYPPDINHHQLNPKTRNKKLFNINNSSSNENKIVPHIDSRTTGIFSTSLAKEPHIPEWVGLLIPFILLINVAMFLSSNTSTGASVYIVITIGENKITMPPVFNFSLKNSIQDMWNAGIYPLSIIIAVFSGFWPYCKIFLMLVSWLIPSSLMNKDRRETMLIILDAMGKWSLIDTHVLVLMSVAFRFHMVDTNSPDVAMDVFVSPDWGFHVFLLATLLSLVLTHVILAFHRNSPTSKDVLSSIDNIDKSYSPILSKQPFPDSTDSPSLQNILDIQEYHSIQPDFQSEEVFPSINSESEILHHPFHQDSSYDSNTPTDSFVAISDSGNIDFVPLPSSTLYNTDKAISANTYISLFSLEKNKFKRIFVCCLILLTMILTVIGVLETSFEFHFKGAAGFVLNFIHSPSYTAYSVFSIADSISTSSQFPNSFAIRWIQIVFYLVVIIIPLMYILFSGFLYIIPLTLKVQKRLFHIVEILHAWSTLDVFVLAVLTSLVEIRQFAIFVMGNRCDLINKILKQYFNTPLDGDDICFDVISTLVAGCWILFVACIFNIIFTAIVLKSCRNSVAQRQKSNHLSLAKPKNLV